MEKAQNGRDEIPLPVSLADVKEAMGRIREHVHYTPCMQCAHLDKLAGLELFFKCELFQRTGSFKLRGATNFVRKLQERQQNDAIRAVSQSSGNHAQALSLAAQSCGIPVEIVMPSNVIPAKIQAIESYGGVVTLGHPSEQAQKDAVAAVMARYSPHALYVPSSDHPDIIAGQGTVAMELLEQVPEIDAIVGSIGGGGLVAGMSVVAKALHPGVKVFGAEPERANDCARSLAAGRIVPNESWPDTVCDALRITISDKPWQIIKKNLSGVVTVTEQEVIKAMRIVWERMKITVEPSAACTVAAVLSPKFKEMAGPDVKRVGVILCGGNVDLDNLCNIISS